jgi:hypothetical protein
MKGQEFFDKLNRNLSVIHLLPNVEKFYREIAASFKEVSIINYYCEVESEKIEVKGTLDILFFDSKMIHRIVVNKTSIDYNSFPIKSVNSVNIYAANNQLIPTDIKPPGINEVKLTILIKGQEQVMFNYIADTGKFSEFLRIKDNLLALI